MRIVQIAMLSLVIPLLLAACGSDKTVTERTTTTKSQSFLLIVLRRSARRLWMTDGYLGVRALWEMSGNHGFQSILAPVHLIGRERP